LEQLERQDWEQLELLVLKGRKERLELAQLVLLELLEPQVLMVSREALGQREFQDLKVRLEPQG
jgi:hypothetical protein